MGSALRGRTVTIVLFKDKDPLSTPMLRAMLRVNFPDFKWAFSWHALQQPGAASNGAIEDLADALIITGTNDVGEMLAMEVVTYRHRLDEPAPDHEWHARLETATQDEALRRPFEYMVCYALIGLHDPQRRGRCRLTSRSEWLDAAALKAVIEADCGRTDGSPESKAPEYSAPAATSVTTAAAAPEIIASGAGPSSADRMVSPDRICRMPALVLLLAALPQQIDCSELARFVRLIDPDGAWTVQPGNPGQIVARGRGATIAVSIAAAPSSSVNLSLAQSRSFWFTGSLSDVADHGAHIHVESDIDTSHDWTATRQTARVMTFIAAHLAGQCPTLAVYNDAIGTVYGPDNCRDMLEVLSHGRLPISLWVWTVLQTLDEDRVGLATLGLEAFMGYELEAWNAALDPIEAQKRFSAILAYLFDQGPTVRHGDTIGTPGADSGTLCRFAEQSALPRGRATTILTVAFDVTAAERASLLDDKGPATTGAPAPALGTAFAAQSDSFDFSSFAA